jgi:hypothetical protein
MKDEVGRMKTESKSNTRGVRGSRRQGDGETMRKRMKDEVGKMKQGEAGRRSRRQGDAETSSSLEA